MKKLIWIYGLILGAILAGNMLITISMCYNDGDFEGSEIVGYAGMVVVFSMIYFGVRTHRNRLGDQPFSFGKGFKMGIWIAFIGSSMYVVAWLFYYYLFIPDFLDKYIAFVLRTATADGATAVELAEKTVEMEEFKEMYKNPVLVVLITYMEVFPVGLLVSAISAFVLRKK